MFLNAFALRHPRISLILSIVPPFIMLPFVLWEYLRVIPAMSGNKRAVSPYQDGETQGASLHHVDGLPILTYHTTDTVAQGRAQAQLAGQPFIEFYLKYLQFLPEGARFLAGPIRQEPYAFLEKEAARRQLDFSGMEEELQGFVQGMQEQIAQYNAHKSRCLQLPPFTYEQLKGIITFGDVYKGIGCSAAVKKINGSLTFMRNLDWFSMGVLGNHGLGVLSPTKHLGNDTSKPQKVFSIGFTPGLVRLTSVNDKGLVISLNEATRMETKNENPAMGAIPQFILIRQIAENCTTVEEVKAFLQANKPATSHILTVMDDETGGVFEILPEANSENPYHFRPLKDDKVCVTNHFFDAEGKVREETIGFECSERRYHALEEALETSNDPVTIIRASGEESSTVQTCIVERLQEGLVMRVNLANTKSASALREEGELRYTEIMLSDLFGTN